MKWKLFNSEFYFGLDRYEFRIYHLTCMCSQKSHSLFADKCKLYELWT